VSRLRRLCLRCGRPVLGTYCPACAPVRSRATRQQRGYDEDWLRRVKAAIERQPWCTYCGSTEDLTGDHPVALTKGGSRDQEPIVACRRCNSSKGART
jgi:5-methylcytosine-specific restriction protein A